MKSLWNAKAAAACGNDPLALRVYTSRLLGQESSLVLHGGGNTSVKAAYTNIFGDEEEVLYVKGSGWDLATIEAEGFAPVRLDALKRMADLDAMTDSAMVTAQRAAMTNPHAPNPSVEAILHAIIPHAYVDHTHADAVVTITNAPGGEERIREIYGERVLIVPYVMPGFILSKAVRDLTAGLDWSNYDGMILLKHGVFSFGDSAEESYERMIALVSKAEAYLNENASYEIAEEAAADVDLLALAGIRKMVSEARGTAVIAELRSDSAALTFANAGNVSEIAGRGPLTPDHVIRTKRVPLCIGDEAGQDLAEYVDAYGRYFEEHAEPHHEVLDPAPRWGVWPGRGVVAFGCTAKENRVIHDIAAHTAKAILRAESLGGWEALSENDIFEMEYWELEQAKLKKAATPRPMQGTSAIVTGGAQGIGRACALKLAAEGAMVTVLDIDPSVERLHEVSTEIRGVICDVTDEAAVCEAVREHVRQFGGLDRVVSNAGIFPQGAKLDQVDREEWAKSLDINLTAHQRLMKACTPFLREGIDPAVVIVGSKNVPAPGPGAGTYSVAKAGLTQLARIAALELGGDGIRVNVVHPNAVFDTGIWTDDVLKSRAAHYNMSVEDYKTDNVLKTEITSDDVAAVVCALAGPTFAKTTGAQIPIDGGLDRVI